MVILDAAIVAIARLNQLSTLALVVLFSGGAWVLFSLVNALVQNLAPDWLRARVLAVFTLVYMGSFALGSALWGGVAQHRSVRLALFYSGVGTIGSAMLALFRFRIPMQISVLGITGVCRSSSKRLVVSFLLAQYWSRSNTTSLRSRSQHSCESDASVLPRSAS